MTKAEDFVQTLDQYLSMRKILDYDLEVRNKWMPYLEHRRKKLVKSINELMGD